MEEKTIKIDTNFIKNYKKFKEGFDDIEKQIAKEAENQITDYIKNFSDDDLAGFNYIEDMYREYKSNIIRTTIGILASLLLLVGYFAPNTTPSISILLTIGCFFVFYNLYFSIKEIKFVKFCNKIIKENAKGKKVHEK